jgi:putative restriction endonuclease
VYRAGRRLLNPFAGKAQCEFGNAGQDWENIGWKVQVNFTALANKVRTKDHIDVLRPFLPNR